jgi:CTP synthase (UTP-ammonia lyase)
LISENLVSGANFERVSIVPKTKTFERLYENFSNVELTSSRFSLYPQLLNQMKEAFIDVEATNQFDDPEILSLSNHPFFLACSFCPQISSTRDIPHPIIYTFLKFAQERSALV